MVLTRFTRAAIVALLVLLIRLLVTYRPEISISVGITLLAFVLGLAVQYELDYKHPGWRRLSFIISGLAAIYEIAMYKGNEDRMLLRALIALTAAGPCLLILRDLSNWIIAGFKVETGDQSYNKQSIRKISVEFNDWLFVPTNKPLSYPAVDNFTKKYLPFIKSSNPNPSGIGDWLALLIFVRFILLAFSDTVNFLSDRTSAVIGINSWLVFIAATVPSIIAAWFLITVRKPISILIAIIALWVSGPVATVLDVSLIHNPRVTEPGSLVLVSILLAVLWTVYLKQSKRVRNTYTR